MDEPQPPPSGPVSPPPRARRIFVYLGLAVLLAIGFYKEENWRGQKTWDAYRQARAAQADTLEWDAFIPTPVRPEQNVFALPKMERWFSGKGPTEISDLAGPYREGGTNPSVVLADITIVPPGAPLPVSETSNFAARLLLPGPALFSLGSASLVDIVRLENVPLRDAIKTLALQARLNVVLDSDLPAASENVSVTWRSVDAAMALAALLNSHDAKLVSGGGSNTIHASPKMAADGRGFMDAAVRASLDAALRRKLGEGVAGPLNSLVFSHPLTAPLQMVLVSERMPTADELAAVFEDLLPANGRGAPRPALSWRTQPLASNVLRLAVDPCYGAADYMAWSEQRLNPGLERIRQALQRPEMRRAGDYAQPDSAPAPNFISMRTVAQALAERAECELLLHHPDKALEDLTLLHDLGRFNRARPVRVVAAMVDSAVTGLYATVIAFGLREHAWNDAELAALQGQLAEVDLLPLFAGALKTEEAATCRWLETASPSDFAKLRENNFNAARRAPASRLPAPETLVFVPGPRGWVYQNMTEWATRESGLAQGFSLPQNLFFPRKIRAYEADLAERNFTPYNFLVKMGPPNYSSAIFAVARNQTAANLARVACALERSRLAIGALPQTLADLAPRLIDRVPRDVVTGQPLQFHRKPDGKFLLYSVGWNETDDGGMVCDWKSLNGDWVWDSD